MFDAFFNIIKVYNFIKVKIVECDNVIEKHSQVAEFLASKSIRIEPSAPNTQGQNGGAWRIKGQRTCNARKSTTSLCLMA
jgi:hypothetical protein